MKNRLWISWLGLIVAFYCAAIPSRSAAQSNLVVNVGITPAISTNLVGATIVLSSTQDVQSVLFDYEWSKNGAKLVDDGHFSGTATAILTITNARETDTGNYALGLYLNGVLQGRAFSAVYVVPVQAGIVTPTSTNLVGTPIVLSATQDVQSIFFDYQWAKDGTPLVDGDRISGSLTPTLTITDSQFIDAGTYTVSLSLTGVVQATASAIVYVVDQPFIESITPFTSGASVTLIANATGGLLSYQWSWQGQPIPGATGSGLTFPDAYADASAGYYSVSVTNPVGATNFSAAGFLFTKPTPSGTYQGLFFDPTNVLTESSGFFQYTLSASKRSFSGKIILGTKTYPFSGAFSLAHDSQVMVPRRNDTPLTLQLQLVTTNDTPQVFGSLTDGNWLALVQGNRLYFTSKIITGLAGRYTLSLLNTNIDPLVPNGSGYGAVLILKNGTAVMSGQAGDGTAISQTCGLSRRGDWPFHVSMFKGRGRLIGWLHVSQQGGSSIQSSGVAWVKDAGRDKLYPNGFGNVMLQPTGSTFVRPTNTSVLSFTNGVAVFTAGDLFSGNIPTFDFVKILIPRLNTFVAEEGVENVRLTVNPGTGIMTGHFVHVVTGLTTPIKAIVLQQQNFAPGFFLSTNASGSFTLSPGTPPM
jgi:hypothetical protein